MKCCQGNFVKDSLKQGMVPQSLKRFGGRERAIAGAGRSFRVFPVWSPGLGFLLDFPIILPYDRVTYVQRQGFQRLMFSSAFFELLTGGQME